jgi:hypothetical protein
MHKTLIRFTLLFPTLNILEIFCQGFVLQMVYDRKRKSSKDMLSKCLYCSCKINKKILNFRNKKTADRYEYRTLWRY